jgi:hypothetical protein
MPYRSIRHAILFSMVLCGNCFAQSLDIYVGFAMGGSTDQVARALSAELTRQNIESRVRNILGVGSANAAAEVRTFAGDTSKVLLFTTMTDGWDTSGLTEVITIGRFRDPRYLQPLKVFAPSGISIAHREKLAAAFASAARASSFQDMAKALNLVIAEPLSSTANADAKKEQDSGAGGTARQSERNRADTAATQDRAAQGRSCGVSIQVLEQQYVNTYTFNGRDTIGWRNNFGASNERWAKVDEAVRMLRDLQAAQNDRARAPAPRKDPFGIPLPPQPAFVPADYSGAIAWAQCLESESRVSAATQLAQNRSPQVEQSSAARSQTSIDSQNPARPSTSPVQAKQTPQSAIDCTKLAKFDDGGIAIKNECTVPVNVAYCIEKNLSSTWSCEKANVSSTDARGAALINPGNQHRIQYYVSDGGGRLIFGSCVHPAVVTALRMRTERFDCR